MNFICQHCGKENKLTSNVSTGFDQFWKAYPRRVAKGNAERAWKKIDPALLPIILLAIEDQKRGDEWREEGGAFIPHPASWLNARRWEDEPMKPIIQKPCYVSAGPIPEADFERLNSGRGK